jgi:hypothetical protein
MNRFAKFSFVVALAVVGSVWSQPGQAQQTHDAVAKARGLLGQSQVVRQTQRRYVAVRSAAQLPPATAQRRSDNATRTFSFDPIQAPGRQGVAQVGPPAPQHSGIHDAGAKVRGEFGR